MVATATHAKRKGRETRKAGARPTDSDYTALLQKAAALADGLDQFPEYPPRDDMMNPKYLHLPAHLAFLARHFGNLNDTIVLSEVPISWNVPRGRGTVRIPDLMVAFNIRHARILAQKGYAISEQGKPPDFVLEVASDTTSRRDETLKWRDYASFGIPEYWMYDPDWGKRYATGLSGWTLVDGAYRAIPIVQHDEGMHYGDSAVLGLQVCWEYGELRWYDPAAGRYLDTVTSLAQRADAVTLERDDLAQRLETTTQQLDTVTLERDDFEQRLDTRTLERDAAVAETQRLRDENDRLRAGRE